MRQQSLRPELVDVVPERWRMAFFTSANGIAPSPTIAAVVVGRRSSLHLAQPTGHCDRTVMLRLSTPPLATGALGDENSSTAWPGLRGQEPRQERNLARQGPGHTSSG